MDHILRPINEEKRVSHTLVVRHHVVNHEHKLRELNLFSRLKVLNWTN